MSVNEEQAQKSKLDNLETFIKVFFLLVALSVLIVFLAFEGSALVHIMSKAMSDFADRCDELFPL